MEEALGAEEVDVGEGGEEEEAFDAGGETDEVEEELAAMLAGFEGVELLDGVHPLHAEVGLFGDGGDIFDGGEGGGTLLVVGDVIVEEGEVELDVDGFFEELAGEIEAGLG